MGSRMANNLIKAGLNVAVHDIYPYAIKDVSDIGNSVKVTSMEVLDVYTGPEGLLNGGNPVRPWLYIDSSTIDPQTTRKLASAVSNCALIEKKAFPGYPYYAGSAPVLWRCSAEKWEHSACGENGKGSGLSVKDVLIEDEWCCSQQLKICNNWQWLDTYNPVPGVMDGVPSSRNYDGGFASTLMCSDMNLLQLQSKKLIENVFDI
ncbi:probable 3-hydroxyisobutyrate dehydrogenase, mitochondrial isoform X1 [Tanacetum coccineum]|uniref:3-hydroxyisobutyrate dehydrogenase n=1 Tax=Tanacetum coccineum TaxID=301880 RepID=A0ABQ5GD47_9ASTR